MKSFFRSFLISIVTIGSIGYDAGGIGGGSSSDDFQSAMLGEAGDTTVIDGSIRTNSYEILIKEGMKNGDMSTKLLNYGVPDIEIELINKVGLRLLDGRRRADIITLFVGTDDISSGPTPLHSDTNLTAILMYVSRIGGVRIFIVDLPDVKQLIRFSEILDKDRTSGRVLIFDQSIRRRAPAFSRDILIPSLGVQNENFVSGIGLYSNDHGYVRMANLSLQRISPTL